jgi:hypothetical protein
MANNVLPNPLPVEVEDQGTDYVDQKIMIGDYFSGYLSRTSTVPETIYRVIKTGAVPLIIESVLSDIDYSSIVDGEYTVSSRIYIDASDDNDWSYTGGTAVKSGKPLNAEFINKEPQYDLINDPVMGTVTGNPDFIVSFLQYFKDTSGNTETLTGVNQTFFADGRKLVIPANSEALVEVITSGDVGNQGVIRSFINYIEPGEY